MRLLHYRKLIYIPRSRVPEAERKKMGVAQKDSGALVILSIGIGVDFRIRRYRAPLCRLFRAVGKQQFEFAHVTIVTIEGGKCIGSFLQHLLGHGDGVAELLEI